MRLLSRVKSLVCLSCIITHYWTCNSVLGSWSSVLSNRNVVSIDGYEDVPENDEAALMKAVSKQPVSVAICASGGLQFYSSGVVDGKCCTELDHGVLAVGYGLVCYLCVLF